MIKKLLFLLIVNFISSLNSIETDDIKKMLKLNCYYNNNSSIKIQNKTGKIIVIKFFIEIEKDPVIIYKKIDNSLMGFSAISIKPGQDFHLELSKIYSRGKVVSFKVIDYNQFFYSESCILSSDKIEIMCDYVYQIIVIDKQFVPL